MSRIKDFLLHTNICKFFVKFTSLLLIFVFLSQGFAGVFNALPAIAASRDIVLDGPIAAMTDSSVAQMGVANTVTFIAEAEENSYFYVSADFVDSKILDDYFTDGSVVVKTEAGDVAIIEVYLDGDNGFYFYLYKGVFTAFYIPFISTANAKTTASATFYGASGSTLSEAKTNAEAQTADVSNALTTISWTLDSKFQILSCNPYSDMTMTSINEDVVIAVSGNFPTGAYVEAYPVKYDIPGTTSVYGYSINVYRGDGGVLKDNGESYNYCVFDEVFSETLTKYEAQTAVLTFENTADITKVMPVISGACVSFATSFTSNVMVVVEDAEVSGAAIGGTNGKGSIDVTVNLDPSQIPSGKQVKLQLMRNGTPVSGALVTLASGVSTYTFTGMDLYADVTTKTKASYSVMVSFDGSDNYIVSQETKTHKGNTGYFVMLPIEAGASNMLEQGDQVILRWDHPSGSSYHKFMVENENGKLAPMSVDFWGSAGYQTNKVINGVTYAHTYVADDIDAAIKNISGYKSTDLNYVWYVNIDENKTDKANSQVFFSLINANTNHLMCFWDDWYDFTNKKENDANNHAFSTLADKNADSLGLKTSNTRVVFFLRSEADGIFLADRDENGNYFKNDIHLTGYKGEATYAHQNLWRVYKLVYEESITIDVNISAPQQANDDVRIDHNKQIDFLGDNLMLGQDNPDTTIDSAAAGLEDLYRLYLDLKGYSLPIDVLIIADATTSMYSQYGVYKGKIENRYATTNRLLFANGGLVERIYSMNPDNQVGLVTFAGCNYSFKYVGEGKGRYNLKSLALDRTGVYEGNGFELVSSGDYDLVLKDYDYPGYKVVDNNGVITIEDMTAEEVELSRTYTTIGTDGRILYGVKQEGNTVTYYKSQTKNHVSQIMMSWWDYSDYLDSLAAFDDGGYTSGYTVFENADYSNSGFYVDESRHETEISSSFNDFGGTSYATGLIRAQELLNHNDVKNNHHEKIVIFMSDGEPNLILATDEYGTYGDISDMRFYCSGGVDGVTTEDSTTTPITYTGTRNTWDKFVEIATASLEEDTVINDFTVYAIGIAMGAAKSDEQDILGYIGMTDGSRTVDITTVSGITYLTAANITNDAKYPVELTTETTEISGRTDTIKFQGLPYNGTYISTYYPYINGEFKVGDVIYFDIYVPETVKLGEIIANKYYADRFVIEEATVVKGQWVTVKLRLLMNTNQIRLNFKTTGTDTNFHFYISNAYVLPSNAITYFDADDFANHGSTPNYLTFTDNSTGIGGVSPVVEVNAVKFASDFGVVINHNLKVGDKIAFDIYVPSNEGTFTFQGVKKIENTEFSQSDDNANEHWNQYGGRDKWVHIESIVTSDADSINIWLDGSSGNTTFKVYLSNFYVETKAADRVIITEDVTINETNAYLAGNSDQLKAALDVILDGSYISGVTLTDSLSKYVELYKKPDLKITLSIAGQTPVTVWQSTGEVAAPNYNVTFTNEITELYIAGGASATTFASVITNPAQIIESVTYTVGGADGSTGQIHVKFNPAFKIDSSYQFTVSYNVKGTQALSDVKGQYGDNLGDFNTDYGRNQTSSLKGGMDSNNESVVKYNLAGNAYSDTYPHPVVQSYIKSIFSLRKVTKPLQTGDVIRILEGAEFTLFRAKYKYDANGNVIGREIVLDDQGNFAWKETQTSNKDGLVIFSVGDSNNGGNMYGTYMLYETKAPNGYYLSADCWYVDVSVDGTVTITSAKGLSYVNEATTSVVEFAGEGPRTHDNNLHGRVLLQIPNSELYFLPDTGGFGTYLFTLLGVGLITAAVLIIQSQKQKNEADA